MFKVLSIDKPLELHTVYNVSYDAMRNVTKFLMFRDGEWDWWDSRSFVPYIERNDKQ